MATKTATQLQIITEFAKSNKKINRPQVVNFIKNNSEMLHIRLDAHCMINNFANQKGAKFQEVDPIDINIDRENIIGEKLTLLDRGNELKYFENEEYIGYNISNCINFFIVAIKK